MIEAGILGEDDHVELLEGLLIRMSPQNRPHAFVVQWLTRTLIRTLKADYDVLSRLPLTLGPTSEPEPDVAVVSAEEARSRTQHPRRALLVIEVADESVRKDRSLKAGIYARAAVPEYWIVNIPARCVEVHSDPDAETGRYRSVVTRGKGDRLRASAVSGLELSVDEILG